VMAGVMLIVNSLWYELAMQDFHDRDSGSWGAIARDKPSFLFTGLPFLTLATLMTIAYPHVSFGRNRWTRGLALGIVTALVFIMPAGFYYLGTIDILVGEVVVADIGRHLIDENASGITIAAFGVRQVAPVATQQSRLEREPVEMTP